ncbi:ParB/RepB/Spo0J family partition protein [Roseovarius sp. MBR-6]|jgi:ParB family chromosome partitioning protein|uniref:ParB/RepB/Spo0J family partition protein n=1 Tax=Roseovarius sp. MBR-6 TaxID=3156459 RepID=UPI0033944F62
MIEHISSVTELPVDAILVEDRLRGVSRATVEAMKSSLFEQGQLQNINVRRKRDGDYLLDGLHRLTAMREMGYKSIHVRLVRCNDAEARLIEIDSNLAGAPLIPVDLAMFLAERKRSYEALHPEARAATGAALIAKRWDTAETISVVSFAKSVQEHLDLSERHIRNYVRAGLLLDRPEAEALRSAKRQVGVMDLIGVGKIGEREERSFVIEALAEGKAATVKAARRAYRAARGEVPAPLSETDRDLARLRDAWSRAGLHARRKFVADNAAEIEGLLRFLSDEEDAA